MKKNPLGNRWYPLSYHETQQKLFLNPVRFPVIPAGRRSGKTELAKRYLCLQALTYKTDYDTNFYFAGAPTREQSKRIFWDDLKDLTKMFHCARPNESDLIIHTEFSGIKSRIQVLGLERPERIEGSPWNGGIIDEMRKIKSFTWYKHIRPALSDRNGWCWRCGVPEGRNEYYEMAIYSSGGIPQTVPRVGVIAQGDDAEQAYYSWYSADILPEKEVESARNTLDPKTFRQEFEGSFEAEEGRVYYAYTPDYFPNGNLHRVKYDKNLPIYLGFDFNVSPMTAILGHIRTRDRKEYFEIFKGYHIKNSNTKSLCEMILNDFSESYTYIVTTCQSGQNRQTVADLGLTDRKIIQNEFMRRDKNIQFANRSKNPLVKDKINSVNSMLYHNRILINHEDKGCKELIKDLESMTYKTGTSDIDTSDPMRGHISDALGYIIQRYWPVAIDEEFKQDLGEYVF